MSRIVQFIIILTALNILGGGFLWYGYSNMQDNKSKEKDLRSQLAEENQKDQKFNALKDTLKIAARDKESLEKYLLDPSEESQIKLISQMEQLGSSTTGTLVNTTSLDLTSGQPKSLHGEFTISGTWSQLYYLLRLIEVFPTRIVIRRFEIKNNADIMFPARWTGTLSLDFVSLKPSS